MFSGFDAHAARLRVLDRALSHPAHGYLFWGPRGVGKRIAAERFAEGLLGNPQTPLETHADFVRVRREEGAREIVIKQSRALVARMHLTSACGGKKVALIEQADRLNEEAANALLKAVEESDSHAVYLFLAERLEQLPATLRSRLVGIAFQRDPAQRMSREGEESETKNLSMLALAPLGVQCALLERFSAQAESAEDTESAWRDQLAALMVASEQLFLEHPEAAVRVGMGLVHAWALAGSSLSPRLALEWAAVRPFLQEETIFSFLHPTYL